LLYPPQYRYKGSVRRQTLVILGALALAVAGGIYAFDAAIVTAEERIGRFANDVTGEVSRDRIRRALEWTEPSRQPVEVDVRGEGTVYDDENAGELSRDAKRALGRFSGTNLRALRESIEVQGDRADLSLKLLTDRGMVNVDYRLRRHGEQWLVSRVRVRR
jgi:hypothetical protein